MGVQRVDSKLGADNVNELKKEVKNLQSNNDQLVNVIATNNASRETIASLERRLAFLKSNSKDQVVNFKPVHDNLDHQKTLIAGQELVINKQLEDVKEDEKKLSDEKSKLKEQAQKLKSEMEELQRQLDRKVMLANRVTRGRIQLEEDVDHIEEQLKFEAEHYRMMQEALELKLGPEKLEERHKFNSDDMVKDLLDDYSKKFKDEYNALLTKQRKREIMLLKQQLDKLNDEKKIKEAQLIKIKKENEDLRKVADEAIKKLAENQEELKKLEAAKKAQDKLQDDKRKELNDRILKLEAENELLTKRIERTQENANEALLVIIQLEFEIKTYERLLNMEQGHTTHVSSPRSRGSSKSHSRSASRGSSSHGSH